MLKNQTPRGARDLMPEEVLQREAILDVVKRVCRRRGFQRVVTPTFEVAEALRPGLVPSLYDLAFKFFDREGRLMMLRPDLTTPIARLVAGRLRDQKMPLRLFTVGNVFRQHAEGGGHDQEMTQIGVELIGVPGARGDAEAMVLGLDLLHSIGVRDARVDIGNAAFLEAVLKKLNLSPVKTEAIRRALRAHNFVDYRGIVRSLSVTSVRKKALEKLPYLRGSLSKAARFSRELSPLGAGRELRAFLALARSVARRTHAAHVTVDFGLIRDFEYYTGAVFEFYREGTGTILGQGGRYDTLIGRYGFDVPATGFAIEVRPLLNRGTK